MANLIGLITKGIISVFIRQKATDILVLFSWVRVLSVCLGFQFLLLFHILIWRFEPEKWSWQDLSFPLLFFPGRHSNTLSFARGIQRRAYIDFCLSADRQAGIIFTFLICLRRPWCGRSSSLAMLRLSCAPGVAAVGWPLSLLMAETRQLCS